MGINYKQRTDTCRYTRRTIMERISNYRATTFTYDKALELFNKLHKVRGYPDSYRRFDQCYRVAVKDDIECGGYIEFWQFGSYTRASEIKRKLWTASSRKSGAFLLKNSHWHEDDRHGLTHTTNNKPYAYDISETYASGVVRVYKNNFIMASTGDSHRANAFGRYFVANILDRDWGTLQRCNKYDYLKHTDGKYYCVNYKGLQIQDGYLVDAHRPKRVNPNFYTDTDFKKYDAILEPYYSWLRDVMSTCTDNEIPAFEPINLEVDGRKHGVWVGSDVANYLRNMLDKLKHGMCGDEDYINLTYVLMKFANSTWQDEGAIARTKDYSGIKRFLSMTVLRNNVARLFTLNDGDTTTQIYIPVEIGKRAWGADFAYNHWVYKYKK